MPENKTDPTVEVPAALSAQDVKSIVEGVVTNALNARDKRINVKLAKLQAAPAQEGDSASTDPTDSKVVDSNPKVATLERRIRDMEKRAKDSERAVRDRDLQIQLSTKLKGKVADNWADVAIDHIKRHIDSETNSFTINDIPYSIDDGVAEWLKAESNKRFLPAPATPAAKPRFTPRATAQGSNNNIPLTREQRDYQIAQELAEEGIEL